MKLTLGEIVDMWPAVLHAVGAKLAPSAKVRLIRVAKKLQAEHEAFALAVNELVERLGEIREGKPKAVFRDSPGRAECDAEVTKLRSMEISISMDPIPVADLDGMEPADIIALAPIITE